MHNAMAVDVIPRKKKNNWIVSQRKRRNHNWIVNHKEKWILKECASYTVGFHLLPTDPLLIGGTTKIVNRNKWNERNGCRQKTRPKASARQCELHLFLERPLQGRISFQEA